MMALPAQLLRTNDVRSESLVPAMYRAASDGGFEFPEVDVGQVDTRFWRRDVDYGTDERVGTLIVDTPAKYLYHVVSRGRATRYGMGVGRDGFEWSGRAQRGIYTAVAAMGAAKLYDLAPTGISEIQCRCRRYVSGYSEPVGRARLYIFEDGRDTLYRLHGTNELGSIGNAVSSGCIRLLNQDVIHLYNNVKSGSPIVVFLIPR